MGRMKCPAYIYQKQHFLKVISTGLSQNQLIIVRTSLKVHTGYGELKLEKNSQFYCNL